MSLIVASALCDFISPLPFSKVPASGPLISVGDLGTFYFTVLQSFDVLDHVLVIAQGFTVYM